MNKLWIIAMMILAVGNVNAQSKKDQILSLNQSIDSLMLVLSTTRDNSVKDIQQLNITIEGLNANVKEITEANEKHTKIIDSLTTQIIQQQATIDSLKETNIEIENDWNLIKTNLVLNQKDTSQTLQWLNNLKTNKTLLPQSIDYDGKPDLEYTINNEIIALDSYDENDREGSYIRMKLNDKEVILKMQKQHSSKARRVYSNSDYVVTFDGIIYGKCAGEGAQYLTGKLLIQTSSDQNTITFKGYDTLYSSKECQEMGNG